MHNIVNIVLHMEDSQLENQLYLLIISMQDIMLKHIINNYQRQTTD